MISSRGNLRDFARRILPLKSVPLVCLCFHASYDVDNRAYRCSDFASRLLLVIAHSENLLNSSLHTRLPRGFYGMLLARRGAPHDGRLLFFRLFRWFCQDISEGWRQRLFLFVQIVIRVAVLLLLICCHFFTGRNFTRLNLQRNPLALPDLWHDFT